MNLAHTEMIRKTVAAAALMLAAATAHAVGIETTNNDAAHTASSTIKYIKIQTTGISENNPVSALYVEVQADDPSTTEDEGIDANDVTADTADGQPGIPSGFTKAVVSNIPDVTFNEDGRSYLCLMYNGSLIADTTITVAIAPRGSTKAKVTSGGSWVATHGASVVTQGSGKKVCYSCAEEAPLLTGPGMLVMVTLLIGGGVWVLVRRSH